MIVATLLFLFYASAAFASNHIVIVCTKDAIFTSLYEYGREFCSSVLDEPCEVTTPVEYATYDAGVISARVSNPT